MKHTISAIVVLLSALGLTACEPGASTKPVVQAANPPAIEKFEVFFDLDSAGITKNGAKIVRSAAADASSGGPKLVFVLGYTDTVGDRVSNKDLSDQRAAAVRAMLAADGVPTDEIVVGGTGDTNPRVPTTEGVSEAQNRRVVITEASLPGNFTNTMSGSSSPP